MIRVGAEDEFDLAVVGAGPAGSCAAITAAGAGLRVVLLDRAAFPRYKTCGGGLIGPTRRNLPPKTKLPVREEINRASFSLACGAQRARESDRPLIATVTRSEFDQSLVDLAVAEGVEFRSPCSVKSVEQDEEVATLHTDRGSVTARAVVGADGSAGRVSRYVGVQMSRIDLGLEVELTTEGLGSEWDERIHIDWGSIPGSYAWVFPKGESLTVGVISAKGRPAGTKEYLRKFVTRMGLERQKIITESGHLTRVREPNSGLGNGRILLAGDAAGLLEPWTREGISYAVRSGTSAGIAVAGEDDETGATMLENYENMLSEELVPEMKAGEDCLRAFERLPSLAHYLITRTEHGWEAFARLSRGETSLVNEMDRMPIRFGVKTVGRFPFAGRE